MKKSLIFSILLNSLCFSIFAQQSESEKYQSQDLIPVATFDKSMAIGLSVTSDNRVFVAFPNYNGEGKYTLTEEKNGELMPYPNEAWNTKGEYSEHLLRVQDLYVDSEDFLWVLDSKPASKGSIFGDAGKSQEGQFKLVKINTKTDEVAKVYLFEDLDKTASGLNDIRIDTEKELAYLSDPGQAAIVVLDLKTGKSRSVLAKTKFTLADKNLVLNYSGTEMKSKDGKAFSSNVNGIALTKDFKYLYFKPINKLNLFRVETKYLADADLSEKELAKKVEDVGEVGITHGLAADDKGNIYLTTSINYTISYVTPEGELHTLVQDARLLWPDSLGTGSDGYLYFTCAQLQRLPQWNNGVDKTEYPYTMYKVKLP
ncbi:L-dopachrome tautomerase-related protein [Chondrinema litorale]|uniref:L-dopachrome tautomerase-related protein n=1 Tax=Chondrinema litorale TaxID=2994555 RepID=UPI00254343E6|nr:L-dopachrome tautomerase-related protein [Chondrinema litorale]UZR96910.1 gluconolactonase [Chondrinema litorale]